MKVFARASELSESQLTDLLARLPSLIRDPSALINNRNGQQTIQGETGDAAVIIKRYVDAYTPVKRIFFRCSRAARAYAMATRLRNVGIPTPRPLLLGACGTDLITVTERVSARELYAEMRSPEWDTTRDIQMGGIIRFLMDAFASHRITHGDLHARNLLVDTDGRYWLIDLDGTRFHTSKWGYQRRRKKDERRFGRSIRLGSPRLCLESGFAPDGSRWLGLRNHDR